ncbi:NFACT RNA binding domain-containing protein [Pelodictyon luteolum]|uniref:Fibronectin-binding protein, putative n=1 Tax=Chlorobium luteolum (strain DSM 273 / BCRC 81028 / 2530) TaxID=319225 RepID=Q3B4Y1_CHLL3|nr:NFACT RNA binding domain-containing protein [Pelodictyon luteolum]ABB23600.1 fibronectin-binding protein, putative [Pelodictyon luteolum DSM 273]
MHRNYFTLLHAQGELQRALEGGILEGIHSQAEGEMTLSCTTAGGEPIELVIFTRSPQVSLFTRHGHHRKKSNSATLWNEVAEMKIRAVAMHPRDRELCISLGDGHTLAIQVFAAKTAVLLLSPDGRVQRTFGKETVPPHPDIPGEDKPSIAVGLQQLAGSPELFYRHIQRNAESGRDPGAGLPGFDRALGRELLRRAGGDISIENLFLQFSALALELLNPTPHLPVSASGTPKFSILACPVAGGQAAESVLEGLRAYSTATLRRMNTEGKMKEVQGAIETRLKKIRTELEAMDPKALEELGATHETFGHLLIASLYRERTDPSSITVGNIFREGTPSLTIPLQPELSLQQNAARYFRKAAKARSSMEGMETRRAELERQEATIGKELLRSMEPGNPHEAARFKRELEQQPWASVLQSGKGNKNSATPFRTIRISDTATLFIGRNALNNDLLTFKHAKPDDIWLHARGASGSHCVLRGSGPDHTDEILKAASIAAWHSSAKHSSLVPVIQTLKKHVRRGRNLPAGQVVVESERVFFVRPSKDGSQQNP